MRIGELAERTGVSPRALRYYDEQGLLQPDRTPGGYRDYPADAVRIVGHIRTLLSAGLGTAVIAEILPCIPDEVTVLAPSCPELLDGLAVERDRIDASVRELLSARAVLDRLLTGSRSR